MQRYAPSPRQSVTSPFAALRGLGLQDDELEALRRQGYLSRRGAGDDGYWRLRFRREGRLRTVYVGRNAELLAAVRRELAELQRRRAIRRRRRERIADGKRQVRERNQTVRRLLAPHGFYFHGYRLRQARGRLADSLKATKGTTMNQASLSSKDARVSPASPATSVVETRAHAPEFVALLGRIREYREQSLENRQPLRAVLGCLTADVLETRSYVSQSLRDDFAESPPGVRDLQGLAPLLALDAGLAKQAVQLIDRGLREAEAEAIETPRLPDRPR